jgi:transposase-like protein
VAGLRSDRSVRELCREHEISDALYYQRGDKLYEGGIAALPRRRLRRTPAPEPRLPSVREVRQTWDDAQELQKQAARGLNVEGQQVTLEGSMSTGRTRIVYAFADPPGIGSVWRNRPYGRRERPSQPVSIERGRVQLPTARRYLAKRRQSPPALPIFCASASETV